MKMDMMGAKKNAIDELMAYLDEKDGEDLGSAIKPKELEVEAVAVEGEEPGEVVAGNEVDPIGSPEGASGEPQLSEEEVAELIEAIQSKLG